MFPLDRPLDLSRGNALLFGDAMRATAAMFRWKKYRIR
jgi:hypothetical protein